MGVYATMQLNATYFCWCFSTINGNVYMFVCGRYIICRIILWHLDVLLGSDCKIGDRAVAIVRQWPTNNNRGMVFSAWSTKQQLNSIRGPVFSVRSVPKFYKQDSWSNKLVVGQSPVGKNMSTEAEDTVGIQAD
jgi:hypothetical protein